MRRLLATAAAAVAAFAGLAVAPRGASAVPYVKHVFIVMLENEDA